MTEAMHTWQKAAADVAKGRPLAELAAHVAVQPETVRRWLLGERIPCLWMWKALIREAGLMERREELLAARDAVARKAGRPKLAKAVRVERLQKQLEEANNERP